MLGFLGSDMMSVATEGDQEDGGRESTDIRVEVDSG